VTQANPAPRLRETQRRLRELIRAPSGPAREREARALLRGDAEKPAEVRLEVYARAWFHRIHQALANDYAALARALGAEGFQTLLEAYLRTHPPSRPSLRDAGAQLPGFLAGPAATPLRERFPFAPDLARLEWAIVEAFDAADAAPLSREALTATPPERWAELCFAFQPALRLLALGFPAQRVRQAHDAEQALPDRLEPMATPVCVWRRQERVYYRALEPLEAEALGQALAGEPFGRLCEAIAARVSSREAPARAAALLESWQAEDWLVQFPSGAGLSIQSRPRIT
jgi:hypothetical protein